MRATRIFQKPAPGQTISWIHQFGDSSNDAPYGLTSDSSGNLYVAVNLGITSNWGGSLQKYTATGGPAAAAQSGVAKWAI